MKKVELEGVVLSVMRIQSIATQSFTPPLICNY